jgi:NAD(P)H-hydrate epimerase
MEYVDRIAVEEFGLGLLQMMENAGRSLAATCQWMLGKRPGGVLVMAGKGANGGGGLCCARHLHNRGRSVALLLAGREDELGAAAASQLSILKAAGMRVLHPSHARDAVRSAALIVDALIGYGLRDAPVGRVEELIELCEEIGGRILSLDIPSGADATTGNAPGKAIRPERVLTLALPKTGLLNLDAEVCLADIGIPPAVYRAIGLELPPIFGNRYWVRLKKTREG